MKHILITLTLLVTSVLSETIEERVVKLEEEVTALKAMIVEPKASKPEATSKSEAKIQVEVLVTNKGFLASNYKSKIYEDSLHWDATFTLKGATKPTRAIKGSLVFMDLFDEPKLRVGWTINEPLQPNIAHTEKGSGIKYNQFTDSHQWLKTTELKDVKVRFVVDSIIYAD
jgi:hypothetical protein